MELARLGVRVLRGDATGYAYTEELSDDRMLEAARTAAQIASSGGAPAPVAIHSVTLPDFYPVPQSSLATPGADKVALLRRADAAARAADPHIVRVEASLAEEHREVLVVTSDGHLARDRQPDLLPRLTHRLICAICERLSCGPSFRCVRLLAALRWRACRCGYNRLLQRGLCALPRRCGLMRRCMRAHIRESQWILRARDLSGVARCPSANFG